MGRSDIPPPTTACLKRCRSEDPFSLAELCSPPPPKQPFTHSSHLHLSILQDLESSLNAAPHNETAPTPEELVTEMMQSLEKVMGDIGELIAAPSVPGTCAVILDPYPCGAAPTCNSPQAQAAHLCIADNLGACSSFGSAASMEITTHNLLRGVMAKHEGCEGEGELPQPKMSHLAISLDDYCRGAASNCDEVEACTADKTEGTNAHIHVDLDSLRNVFNSSEGDLDGICDAGRAAEVMAEVTEQNDGQWNLLEDFADEFAASALSNNHIDWLEEGCDLPAFTLAQIEEEGLLAHATDNTELLLLDCYL